VVGRAISHYKVLAKVGAGPQVMLDVRPLGIDVTGLRRYFPFSTTARQHPNPFAAGTYDFG